MEFCEPEARGISDLDGTFMGGGLVPASFS
jgi:hypothetical protein